MITNANRPAVEDCLISHELTQVKEKDYEDFLLVTYEKGSVKNNSSQGIQIKIHYWPDAPWGIGPIILSKDFLDEIKSIEDCLRKVPGKVITRL
jgi:hypothetical protein